MRFKIWTWLVDGIWAGFRVGSFGLRLYFIKHLRRNVFQPSSTIDFVGLMIKPRNKPVFTYWELPETCICMGKDEIWYCWKRRRVRQLHCNTQSAIFRDSHRVRKMHHFYAGFYVVDSRFGMKWAGSLCYFALGFACTQYVVLCLLC